MNEHHKQSGDFETFYGSSRRFFVLRIYILPMNKLSGYILSTAKSDQRNRF